ncbi:AbrB/MazE/SpoVT family DNA-binding domain-containing protein [Candidatus Bathyarchaeota archaeon]|nr:AbrB/MazE/SpoVT family DNA-binding domain-containing protein [Candidatus Bathyarchaeota archaeon]
MNVKVDSKGRVLIPKSIREMVELKDGSYVNVTVQGRRILIEPLEPVASKYRGAFKIVKWPEDLDEFIFEVMRDWWKQRAT